jgi:L-ribulokinase
MNKYALGLDFGTNSCRSLVVSVTDGREVASDVFHYLSGSAGVITDSADPNVARQNPADYLKGIETIVPEVLKKARLVDPQFDATNVIGIGIDTTGSSPMPIDAKGLPLCFDKRFNENPAAHVWLWKDHSSYREAAQITELAAKIRPQYLATIGGAYSSEWFWSKILHCKNTTRDVYEASYSFIEICDWIPAILVGDVNPKSIKRSVCAAGHKGMYSEIWQGLPDKEFLELLSPGLGALRDRLYDRAYTADTRVGTLSSEWAGKLGLPTSVVVAVGAIDAHMGAVGAGISQGTLVKILGTSTCDIMIWPRTESLEAIPGVCGIVNGSVISGYYGIEAGQSAVGDIFSWFVNNLVPETYGAAPDEKFKNVEIAASALHPGESGLLALDWNNGNRNVLTDVRLTGLVLGQSLYTRAHEIYRALIEATAFGALTIIDRIESYEVRIERVVNCGGLAVKSPLLMQIYADCLNRPMIVSRSEQTPALGAAMFGAVVACKNHGGYDSIQDAQRVMTGTGPVYHPNPVSHAIYKRIYKLYCQVHDAFGVRTAGGGLYNVMKDLLEIRDEVRNRKSI